MKGFLGVLLLVACALPAFTHAQHVTASDHCAELSEGEETTLVFTHHRHLDGDLQNFQYVRVIVPKLTNWVHAGSKLVACEYPSLAPTLALATDNSSYIVKRDGPGPGAYVELKHYVLPWV